MPLNYAISSNGNGFDELPIQTEHCLAFQKLGLASQGSLARSVTADRSGSAPSRSSCCSCDQTLSRYGAMVQPDQAVSRRKVFLPSCSTLPSSSAAEANSWLGSPIFSPSSRTAPPLI